MKELKTRRLLKINAQVRLFRLEKFKFDGWDRRATCCLEEVFVGPLW